MLDLDFEGPSLHSKFGPKGEVSLGKGGFEDYFIKSFENNLYSTPADSCLSLNSKEDLSQFTYDVPRIHDSPHNKGYGHMRLVPCGNIFDNQKYWDTIWSPLWNTFFSIHHKHLFGLINEQQYNDGLSSYKRIKKNITNFSPSPDYLLIDMRPGASELANSIITLWVDVLVVLFPFNTENLQYLTATMPNLLATIQKNDPKRKFRIIPVLCRIPEGAQYQDDREIKTFMESLNMRPKDLNILHSDRELQSNEKLRFGYESPPANTRLTLDYLQLFHNITQDRRPVDEIRSQLGLPSSQLNEERLFHIQRSYGAMINPEDKSRNVSFKVETFQLILSGISDYLESLISDMGEALPEGFDKQNWFHTCLFTTGEKCGKKFGKALQLLWKDEFEFGENEEMKIRKWCEFDSSVGFGRFHVDPTSVEMSKGEITHIDIILTESFLTPANDIDPKITKGEHRFCSFFQGYIDGVLTAVLGRDITVHHTSHMKPDTQISRSESCVFSVEKKEITNG